jgi:hypothetical protein
MFIILSMNLAKYKDHSATNIFISYMIYININITEVT